MAVWIIGIILLTILRQSVGTEETSLATSQSHENASHEPDIFNISDTTDCQNHSFPSGSFEILSNSDVYISENNMTILSPVYNVINGSLLICLHSEESAETEGGSAFQSNLGCEFHIVVKPGQFTVLENGSVYFLNENLLPGTYELSGDRLLICISAEDMYVDYEDIPGATATSKTLPKQISDVTSIYVGNTFCGISIVALMIYLLIFSLISDLRNLPGWNLTSMNVALLLAYSTHLIGQIPQVIGTACVVSACFQQYFYLAYFFWMNVMSFDIWRSLRNSTKYLMVSSNKMKRRFTLYSAYGWGMPLLSTCTAIIFHNNEDAPVQLRPQFGKDDICWFNNHKANAYLFVLPGVIIFIGNMIFFILSCWIIVYHTMENSKGAEVAAKTNFILYTRLAIIMGITWLMGIIAVFTSYKLWLAFTVLLTSQGVVILVLFTFTRKVWNYFKRSGMRIGQIGSFKTESTSASVHHGERSLHSNI